MFALWQIYQWSFETKNPIHIETKTCSCCRSRQSNCSSFDLLESILNKVQRLLKQNKTSPVASRRPNLFLNFQSVSALLSLTKKPEFFFLKLCVLDTDIGADMPELLIFRNEPLARLFCSKQSTFGIIPVFGKCWGNWWGQKHDKNKETWLWVLEIRNVKRSNEYMEPSLQFDAL